MTLQRKNNIIVYYCPSFILEATFTKSLISLNKIRHGAAMDGSNYSTDACWENQALLSIWTEPSASIGFFRLKGSKLNHHILWHDWSKILKCQPKWLYLVWISPENICYSFQLVMYLAYRAWLLRNWEQTKGSQEEFSMISTFLSDSHDSDHFRFQISN